MNAQNSEYFINEFCHFDQEDIIPKKTKVLSVEEDLDFNFQHWKNTEHTESDLELLLCAMEGRHSEVSPEVVKVTLYSWLGIV